MKDEFMFSRRGFLAAFGLAVTYGVTAGCVAQRRDGEILIAHGTEPQKFGIMSFNIRHGEGMDGQVDLARTAAAIQREKPRFAGLSEVDCCTKRTGGIDQAKALAKLTGMHSTFGRAIDLQGGQYGVADRKSVV